MGRKNQTGPIPKIKKLKQKVVNLRDLNDLSFREVGEILGISKQSAHYHYHKAKDAGIKPANVKMGQEASKS